MSLIDKLKTKWYCYHDGRITQTMLLSDGRLFYLRFSMRFNGPAHTNISNTIIEKRQTKKKKLKSNKNPATEPQWIQERHEFAAVERQLPPLPSSYRHRLPRLDPTSLVLDLAKSGAAATPRRGWKGVMVWGERASVGERERHRRWGEGRGSGNALWEEEKGRGREGVATPIGRADGQRRRRWGREEGAAHGAERRGKSETRVMVFR